MKKNKRVAQSAERKLQKKKELENLSNKQLVIFTVGLIAEVILMFFYSAIKAGYKTASKARGVLLWGALAFLVIFVIFLILSLCAKKKPDNNKKVKSFRNWGFCSLAFAVGAFITGIGKVGDLLSKKPTLDPTGYAIKFFGQYGKYLYTEKIVIAVMILVAVYVIAAMIVYAVKSAKVKKSR